ncbi:MFS transporter [Anaerococcus vaginimassiliensis]|uniref:MFS transporter n=1 Tax=Anaerococcus vaginimassiliensis TaxID=2042308 RepID=UPI0010317972|nr:MFS transporter [Anaerococcus vaginimassiliensis]
MLKNPQKRPAFLRPGRIGSFLSIVFAGQLAYASFEAFKGSLMLPLTQALGINLQEFSYMMSMLGIATYLYIPGGWVNNRFSIRSILVTWLFWRMATGLFIFLVPNISFSILVAIAISWGVWDAIGWPAVTNGVNFVSSDANKEGKGLAMGLLESIRRTLEFVMNGVIIIMIAIWPDKSQMIMKIMGIIYTLTMLPNILAILKYVPKNAIAKVEGESSNVAALKGLVKVMKMPAIWLAGLSGLCLYWCYMNLIYSSAPYLSLVFNASEALSGTFGIINTGFMGIIGGALAGYLADYLFKSSTKMLAVALGLTSLGSLLVYILPKQSGMWISVVLLMVMSIGVFMGKAVMMAPIAELNLDESISGSAMSVGSFLAYASIFWAPIINAKFIEASYGPAQGYKYVFLTTVIVAAVGAICAVLLINYKKKAK